MSNWFLAFCQTKNAFMIYILGLSELKLFSIEPSLPGRVNTNLSNRKQATRQITRKTATTRPMLNPLSKVYHMFRIELTKGFRSKRSTWPTFVLLTWLWLLSSCYSHLVSTPLDLVPSFPPPPLPSPETWNNRPTLIRRNMVNSQYTSLFWKRSNARNVHFKNLTVANMLYQLSW